MIIHRISFTKEFADISPEEFVEETLLNNSIPKLLLLI